MIQRYCAEHEQTHKLLYLTLASNNQQRTSSQLLCLAVRWRSLLTNCAKHNVAILCNNSCPGRWSVAVVMPPLTVPCD